MLGKLMETKPLARKVAILGAAGGIGQPLALLLKKSKYVSDLFLHDIIDTAGLAADLSDIDTKAKVTGYSGVEQLQDAVRDAEIILISAGVPRKPGMCRNDLFQTNANVVRYLVKGVAESAPEAIIGVITNPLNSTVPVAAGVLEKAGVFDPSRLFGITTLDSVRASKFVAEMKGLDPSLVKVSVVGGHSGRSIIPLLSQCSPCISFTEEEARKITEQVREAGTKVMEAKAGKGSATLSMAHSAARFTESICRGLQSELDVVECAYVRSDVTRAQFFSTPVVLGCRGIERNLGLGQLSEYEERQLEIAVSELNQDALMAKEFLEKERWAYEELSFKRPVIVVKVQEEPKELKEYKGDYKRLEEISNDKPCSKQGAGTISQETESKTACSSSGGKVSGRSMPEQLETKASECKDSSGSKLTDQPCKAEQNTSESKSTDRSGKPCKLEQLEKNNSDCKSSDRLGSKLTEKTCKPVEVSGCNPPKESACDETDVKVSERGQAAFTGCNKPTDCDK